MSSDVLPSVPVHPTEDLLEEYSFGRVPEPELAGLEEHLLACELCQSNLEALDEYRMLMKRGIAAFERERRESLVRQPRFVFPKIPGVSMQLAAAFLLVLASAIVAWRLQLTSAVNSPTATVRLIAMRGGEGDGVAHVPSGHPMNLVIDRTSLPSSTSYRLEVVNSSGHQIWNGAAQVTGSDIAAHLAGRFPTGVYWVRLYSGDQLLREFGLHVK